MVATMALVFMVFLITADVAGRYIFSRPIPGAYELNELALAPVTFLGLAYTALARGHISIDFFMKRMPPKIQSTIDVVINLIGIALFSVVAFQGVKMALHSKDSGLTTDILAIPTYPFWFLVPIGSILLCLILVAEVLEIFIQLGGKIE